MLECGDTSVPPASADDRPAATATAGPDGCHETTGEWAWMIGGTFQWDERDGRNYRGDVVSVERDTATMMLHAPGSGSAQVEVRRLKDLDGLWVVPRTPAQLTEIPLTDIGNGERLVARFGRDVRYSHVWGKWLVYDERRFKVDDSGSVRRMAKATTRGLLEEAATIGDADRRRVYVNWWMNSESNARQAAMISQAASEPGIPVDVDRLDADPWSFNVLNGTIDLRSGRLRKHSRGDLITCLAPVEYHPDAPCPLWDALLSRAFGGDADVIAFVQRLFGMALTGDVSAQILPIFYGEGANGKSTMLGAVLEILGTDYGIIAPPGLLVVRRNDSHPTERASLFRKRLVVDMESAEDARLNETLVKQLTGGDRITARRMREDFWTFSPTHKLIMCTNHKPVIRETKSAIWRRVKLVPFTVKVPLEEQDPELPKKLRAEYAGILAWAVRGCLDWQQGGLRVPKAIETATTDYCKAQDPLADFLADECNLDPSNADSTLRCRASYLYQRYRRFTEGSGEAPLRACEGMGSRSVLGRRSLEPRGAR